MADVPEMPRRLCFARSVLTRPVAATPTKRDGNGDARRALSVTLRRKRQREHEGPPERVAARVGNILVSRDQFNVTPEGITHKPTGASFIPDIDNPLSGSIRAGQLKGEPRTGDRYDPETVKRMMEELWAEYVEANPTLFKTSR
ncbi:hypothetical protein QA640_30420 [Bradyrhizobium sp. CB82]|uniref:hypothetical protein n=1 Tax=Bradyrhizobium sp. CB82 TaxID=3039159 RepID=UPI0024B1A902|nr:hypothetical protein [Bradyrhizobium sp. CB82]WFU38711.1 hypothetical protein QA640_30420 [Bradyrhizobium sp. CB82]